MRNIDKWKTTKFVYDKKNNLISSRDTNEVGVSSRLMADSIAKWYQLNLKEHAKGNLLDLGCGKAPLYSAYKDFVESVTLADWANSLHDNEHLDVVCDITEKLPFKDSKFDTIILSDVLEHIPNPSLVMSELNRVLKPRGKAIINVPFMYWLHETPYDYHRYTEFMLQKLASDAGFAVIKNEALAGGWAVLIDLSSKLLNGKPKLARLVQFIGPRLLNKRLNTRLEFPLAYGLVLEKNDEK